MSGNYDYPPASDRQYHRNTNPERSQSGRQSQLQNLRNLLSERARRRSGSITTARALETLNQEIEQLRPSRVRHRSAYEEGQTDANTEQDRQQGSSSTRNADHIRRRVLYRERERTSNASPSSERVEQAIDSLNNQLRLRWLTPGEALSRIRESRANRPNNESSDDFPPFRLPPELEQAVAISRARESRTNRNNNSDSSEFSLLSSPHGLEEAATRFVNEHFPGSESPLRLFNLSPSPYPEPHNPPSWDDPPPRSESPGSLGTRWRAKRRKLDSDDHREGLKGFTYGHYGQVVPGLLKMEIESCDGGTYYDENGDSSWPGNVLLNDASVYCTKKSNCNLILKHRGETPFSLKKIIIKAPKKGFDAAIQEGMVFVSMTSEELLERTARYQIHYESLNRRCHRPRRQYSQPSHEYMNAYRSPLQVIERSDSSVGDSGVQTESQDPFATPETTEPQFRVTTEHDDNSDGGPNDNQENDEFPSATEIELMNFGEDGELFCPEEGDESDDDEASVFNQDRFEMRRRFRDHHNQHGAGRTRLATPSRIVPTASFGEFTSQESDVIKPHAQFFIKRENSMVSIKFDPPPSGRFILIKLFSPRSGGNIDIESIMVHGFAGTRYFPSLEFR
ncbi:hypothetical protein BGW36DRAFT_373140 [Talaromyces proteolyticus]|uniref:Uncharacterized protein n=1 Tax=Talaromyces proteolyticus TaxID=1131652 RepID=A0AAD4L1V3_9EURO|nr:uncharacterized protein BGW36DRAFT_373140 [Talaromyces proteolyticus]KAH8702581.1 hypothetical protein BGW36DRAFT_373140 [Talaromyces proteolyticus]